MEKGGAEQATLDGRASIGCFDTVSALPPPLLLLLHETSESAMAEC